MQHTIYQHPRNTFIVLLSHTAPIYNHHSSPPTHTIHDKKKTLDIETLILQKYKFMNTKNKI